MQKSPTPDRTAQAFGDLLPLPAEAQIVVVLVESRDARNIGSVARAMSNLGVQDLRLVTPGRFDLGMARSVACWGAPIIEGLQRFETLSAAVHDAHEVVGFASDSAEHRVPQLLLDEWVASAATKPHRTVALVFGSEEAGLRREHYPICQFLVRIPSSAQNPSYNLAQSVLVALYALRRSLSAPIGAARGEWPTSSQLDHFSEMVLKTAEDVGFLNQHSPQHIRDVLHNLSRRGHLSTHELRILTGLFGKIRRTLSKE